MRARGVRVAHEREPPDELARSSSATIERRVRVALQRADVAALLPDAAPAASPRAASPPPRRRPRSRARRARARRRERPAGRVDVHRDDHPGAAAARVAGGGERAVGQQLDGGDAAEEEVPAPPADELVAERREPVELGRVVAALAVDVRLVDVDPGRVDRLLDAEAVLEHVDDDLHDRATQPRRAGAADDEPRRCRRARARSSAPSCSSAARPGRGGRPPTRSYSPSMLFR